MRPYEQRFPWTPRLEPAAHLHGDRATGRGHQGRQCAGSEATHDLKRLKRLEESVGHRLIVRNPNSFRVTRAGRALYQECTAIFGSISQIPALLEAGDAELAGTSASWRPAMSSRPMSTRCCASFAQDHPKVTFSVVVADSSEVVALIEQNRASFGFCLLGSMPRALDARVLYREFFALYCGPSHRLFDKTRCHAGGSARRSVGVVPDRTGGRSARCGQAAARPRPTRPGPRGVSANLPEVRRMIIAEHRHRRPARPCRRPRCETGPAAPGPDQGTGSPHRHLPAVEPAPQADRPGRSLAGPIPRDDRRNSDRRTHLRRMTGSGQANGSCPHCDPSV
jgi:hypothetical protein